MSSKLRSPAAVARLILVMALLLGEETGRDISRYRFSSGTLRRVSRRSYIRAAFVTELEEELAQLGWTLISVHSDLYAIVATEKIESWMQVSSKRLNLDFTELPDGTMGRAFREFLEDPNHPHQTIHQMSDDQIISLFDGVDADDEVAYDEDE